ncbi:MAG: hypothetical protein QOE26_2792 [Verrucomicrobiota bacterium]|jgi:hypothetical protein
MNSTVKVPERSLGKPGAAIEPRDVKGQANLIARFIKMLKCDTARISRPLARGKMFLIIGWHRNTKSTAGQHWMKDGKPFHFNYVEEQCVASGLTVKDLVASAQHYKWLRGKTWIDLLTTRKGKSVLKRWRSA